MKRAGARIFLRVKDKAIIWSLLMTDFPLFLLAFQVCSNMTHFV
jgi:hypothetical protein